MLGQTYLEELMNSAFLIMTGTYELRCIMKVLLIPRKAILFPAAEVVQTSFAGQGKMHFNMLGLGNGAETNGLRLLHQHAAVNDIYILSGELGSLPGHEGEIQFSMHLVYLRPIVRHKRDIGEI